MGYCKPFKRGASWRSQNYGAFPSNGTNGPAGHSGYDEACDIGTPVHAAGDGVVVYAGQFDDTYADNLLWLIDFGGNIIVLDCGDAEPTFVYAHLSKFRVKAGDRVRKGQVIADSGNSGTRTTGPHCHVEAIPPGYVLNSPSLGRVNPDIYLTEWPDDFVGGLAAMGGAITPLSEEDDMNEEQERKLNSLVDWVSEIVDNGATKSDLENQAAKTPAQVWSYKNPALGTGDAFQILRDAVAGSDKVAQMVAGVAAKAAVAGATEEQITAAVIKALKESTVKVDISVGAQGVAS